jgi:hypothetical protein
MIHMPRRSVTRFFIPLIDVLTVLFCIFLLMPLIKPTADGTEAAQAAAPPGTAADRPSSRDGDQDNSTAEEVRKQLRELELLQRQKIETLQQRLVIRVLEIDADSGKLFASEGGERMEIASQAEAVQLINRHKQDSGAKEVYYLFLFPRRLTGYPEERQVKQYEEWFKDVAHGRDNPLAAR